MGTFRALNSATAAAAFSYARYNFSNGFFVGSQRNTMGLGSFGQSASAAWISLSEGAQFGYSLKNGGGPPITFFAGFDTLKYNGGIGSNAFAPFNSKSGTLPVSSAYAGVEFQPTSNLSLSLGVGVVQQTGRIDSEINSLPGASSFSVGGRRFGVRPPSPTEDYSDGLTPRSRRIRSITSLSLEDVVSSKSAGDDRMKLFSSSHRRA